ASLKIPAVLVSISHFPPEARPQAGFSFAPFVYEYFITEGSTRHLAVFYGEFPKPEIPQHGDCEIRKEQFIQTKNIIGNRVWFDANKNGIQDSDEGGVGGICVSLYDANNMLLQTTTTDSNGYYGFNVETGKYSIEIQKPAWLEFTQKNVGDENQDSDADQATGRIDAVESNSSLRYLDAGLILTPNSDPPSDSSSQLPEPVVGPVRSGRLLYRFIGAFYQNSCLIYASADEEVLARIPDCATVPHTDAGGGAMLPLTRMQKIAEENSRNRTNFDYSSNLFSDALPAGGVPAVELQEYWALLNQSKWVYDAAAGAWWRYVDESNIATAGILHPEVDRLNGRQLLFENIIVMFAPHIVVKPTIVDIDLKLGDVGDAYLFRDGQMYEIRWSTIAGEYEQITGLRRPMHFVNVDGSPAALKPGHTWVVILDKQSYLEDLSSGKWLARFIAPAGAK
ncbi:MAG TPA: SdrD B-like domain-containing protein, partial [Anaerolineales bacterium]|nr:SdrD B-like domain-containing protein [Anaerolineales bacterium]